MMSADKPSIPVLIYRFLSSVGLATVLLIILMIETWLATLEQVNHGLHDTLQKYFNYRHAFVFPDAAVFSDRFANKVLPPLPGGYWVCALLLLNLTLGGIVRIRKKPQNIGVLLSHFGIMFMIVAGGVSQLREERGVMMLREGQTADFAQDLIGTSIEIMELKDGKIEGPVHLIADKHFTDLKMEDVRTVKLPSLPFDLQLQGYLKNAAPIAAASAAPANGEQVIDGWFLFSQKPENESERNTPGLYARLAPRDGGKGEVFLLSTASFQPYTVKVDGKTFLIRLNKRIWPVPFEVRLTDARSKFYPNTSRPESYESDIVRIENGHESKVFIEMNEPMRYAGFTFFQRTMSDSRMTSSGEATISGFEVVRNPSDKWPEYSIIIAGFGLVLHFGAKLVEFVMGRRNSKQTA